MIYSRIGLLILLAFYLATGVPVATFHRHHKACEAKHEGIAVDACHLRIFHGDRISGCKDTSHLTKQLDRCKFKLSDLTLSSHSCVNSQDNVITLGVNEVEISTSIFPFISEVALGNKGPPAS